MSAASRWGTPVSLIRLEGADTRRFLHGQSSQAIELAQPGTCLATCLISPTARMRGLALVAVEDTGADLIVIAGDGKAIRSGLDRVLFPADNVRLGAMESATLWQWQGDVDVDVEAEAAELLRPGVDLGSGPGAAALLQRSRSRLPFWLEALPEWSSAEVESNRLRHGLPAAPGELNDDTNPFELGLADWVSLNKGCYVGQETLAKLATYDGVKQKLRYWRSDYSVKAGESICTPNMQKAGKITSSNGKEGLALIRRGFESISEMLVAGKTLTIHKHFPAA